MLVDVDDEVPENDRYRAPATGEALAGLFAPLPNWAHEMNRDEVRCNLPTIV